MCMVSDIVNYNTTSLNERPALIASETKLMKTQVYDRFGGGLLVLIMLTIAVIAGQSEPRFDEPSRTETVFELGAGFQVTIDKERLAELETLSSVVEAVVDLPIRIDVSTEESESALADVADSKITPVQ